MIFLNIKGLLKNSLKNTFGADKKSYEDELKNYPPPTVTPIPTDTIVPDISHTSDFSSSYKNTRTGGNDINKQWEFYYGK